jgi:hypothetical protein
VNKIKKEMRVKESPIHSDCRLLDEGFARFSRLWSQQSGRLVSKRLEGALGRRIRCEMLGAEARDLTLHRNSVRLQSASPEDAPHAVLSMNVEDWSRVLSGELHVMSIALAGRAPFRKDQRRLIMQFSMLLQATMLSAEGSS